MEAQEAQYPPQDKPMENMEAQTQTPSQATPAHLLPNKPSTCSKVMLFVNLASRILTAIFLFIALIVLATDNVTYLGIDLLYYIYHFQDVVSYRYVMAVIVIGLAYSLVQTGFTLYQVITGKRVCKHKAMLHFDFYADKVVSGLLATGAGAGLAVTVDLNGYLGIPDFLAKGAAVSSLVLFAFLFTEVSQIVSSYSLPSTSST